MMNVILQQLYTIRFIDTMNVSIIIYNETRFNQYMQFQIEKSVYFEMNFCKKHSGTFKNLNLHYFNRYITFLNIHVKLRV
jgi:hypothetical protein